MICSNAGAKIAAISCFQRLEPGLLMCVAAIVGDIPPNSGVSTEEKAKLEQDAIKDIKDMLGPDTPAGF